MELVFITPGTGELVIGKEYMTKHLRSGDDEGVIDGADQGCFKRSRQQWACLDAGEGIVFREFELDRVLGFARVDDLPHAGLASTRKVSPNNMLQFAMVDAIGSKFLPKTPGHVHQRNDNAGRSGPVR